MRADFEQAAHNLAMLALQSIRYERDVEYRDAVDAILSVTLPKPKKATA